MKLSTLLLLVCALALPTVVLAQTNEPFNRIKVTFEHPVKVNTNKTLQPGTYVFNQERTKSQPSFFRIAEASGKEVAMTPTPTVQEYKTQASDQRPQQSEITLKEVGNNWYLDNIWFQGLQHGYHFNLAPKGTQGNQVIVKAENWNTKQNASNSSGMSNPSDQ